MIERAIGRAESRGKDAMSNPMRGHFRLIAALGLVLAGVIVLSIRVAMVML